MSKEPNKRDAKINYQKLSTKIEVLKAFSLKAFNQLQESGHPNWYCSFSLESRQKKGVTVDPRSQKSQVKDDIGYMLRIYDGETMHEQASNSLVEEELSKAVLELVNKVKTVGVAEPKSKVYRSPTWSHRLSRPLANPIADQIPENPGVDTWVHFGTPIKQDLPLSVSETMSLAQSTFDKLQETNLKREEGELAKNPDYSVCDMQLNLNEFLFVDESVRMSQSLCRNRAVAMLVKNSERVYSIQGGVGGAETLQFPENTIETLFDEMNKLLSAQPLTPGRYKLLMHPAVSGVFAHEAFGHSQEGDTWARGRSKAKELYESQEKVGNKHATILNNPALFENGEEGFAAWGSYFFDEEGWLSEEHCLVNQGVLQRPMTNLTSALRLGVERTANGKREDWTHGIYTRQTNTYFSAGDKTFDELMKAVDYGFYARHSAGGMEDPKGMGIQVGILYLEEIRNGQFTGQVFKGPNGGSVQMTGYVPDTLNAILDKSKIKAETTEADGEIDPWNEVGGCGKYHKESVDAGCGGPYMLMDKVLLS